MRAERDTFFVFDPCRTLSEGIVGLLYSGLWLAIAIHRGDVQWALVAGSIVAFSLFMIFHSLKWCLRMWRGWLS